MADLQQQKRRAAEHYSRMTNEELERLAGDAWTLTAAGKEALQAELVSRSLRVDLATGPPVEATASGPVTIRRFTDMPEALLAKGALESAGIESLLTDETTIRMDWLWSNALGGIKLQVKPEDAEAAVQLLDQRTPEQFDVEGVGEFNQPRCPRCDSADLSYTDLDKRVAYTSILLAGIPLALQNKRWKCETCGHEWRLTDESKTDS